MISQILRFIDPLRIYYMRPDLCNPLIGVIRREAKRRLVGKNHPPQGEKGTLREMILTL